MQLFWYDGQLIKSGTLELAIADPGLLYGATVFTTLRVYGQSLQHPITAWRAHCLRLQTSMAPFRWVQPQWERVQSGAEAIAEHFPVLRITIFPDGREWITGRLLPADLTERQQRVVVAWLAEATDFQRPLAAHKTGNYLPAWLAQQTARDKGAQEAILVDHLGCWLETSTGNLWGLLDGEWWTPPLDHRILPGLMRSQLIDWLISQNRTIREEPWCPDLVMEFEAIAYCNSVVEVIPIHAILRQGSQLAYDPFHPGFRQLRGLFRGQGLTQS